jgi:anti-sigma regulatory factor (Ser/Thr protein kinase)
MIRIGGDEVRNLRRATARPQPRRSAGATARIDSWVENAAALWGASERTIFGARLCIAELAANVLEHGRSGSSSDHIIVTICQLIDGIGIEFLDSREAFDPTAKVVAAKSASEAASGRRGLMLVHAYADSLSYFNDGTYNRVKLKIKSA